MHKATSKNRHNHHANYNLQDDYENIKDAFAEATQDVKAKVATLLFDSINQVKDKGYDVKENVQEYVVKKPLKSIAIATVAGLILGYFLRK